MLKRIVPLAYEGAVMAFADTIPEGIVGSQSLEEIMEKMIA